MNRRTFLSTAIVGTSALCGCLSMFQESREDTPLPEVPTGSWTQYGANGANTFATDATVPPRGNLAWTSAAFTRWQPVVSDGAVYMTNFDPSKNGSVIALDALDGAEQWRTTLDADEDNGIVFVDDRCIVAYDAKLVALDPESGERRWTQTTRGISDWELLVADESTGAVLLASRHGIEAFDVKNGERRWEVEMVHHIVRAPAVDDGRVFAVGRVDGATSLVSLSLEDGTKRWQTELGSNVDFVDPIATPHGIVCFNDGSIDVYDRESGTRRREIYSFDESQHASLNGVAVDDGTAFVTNSYGAVAVDVETGTERWHRDASVPHDGICVGAETVVLPLDNPEFTSGNTTISALDRETGETRWYYGFDLDDDPQVLHLRALADGAVFFTVDGNLATLGDVDG